MSVSEFDLADLSTAPRTSPVAKTPTSDRAFPGNAAARDLNSSIPSDTTQARRSAALHRIREVRREQGVSTRRAAQLMGKSAEQVQREEDAATDLMLSQVYEWQRLLEVPVADLLVEPYAPLSAPVLRRAQLVRLMKTVQAIMEQSQQGSVRRLAQTMIHQLIEIMPELEGVTPWHSLDRRTQDQNSRVLEHAYRERFGDVAGSSNSAAPTDDEGPRGDALL